MDRKLRNYVLCGIFSALSLISFIVESLFPPLFLPNARMGISNIFIILAIVVLNGKFAIAVMLIKVLLGSILTGNTFAILYSLPAGIISVFSEIVLLKFSNRFSLVSISVFSAVINSTVQNAVFCLITEKTEYFTYLPYLSLISVLSGVIVGLTCYLVIKILPKNVFNTN